MWNEENERERWQHANAIADAFGADLYIHSSTPITLAPPLWHGSKWAARHFSQIEAKHAHSPACTLICPNPKQPAPKLMQNHTERSLVVLFFNVNSDMRSAAFSARTTELRKINMLMRLHCVRGGRGVCSMNYGPEWQIYLFVRSAPHHATANELICFFCGIFSKAKNFKVLITNHWM